MSAVTPGMAQTWGSPADLVGKGSLPCFFFFFLSQAAAAWHFSALSLMGKVAGSGANPSLQLFVSLGR